jgi:hypothetical protein
MGEYPRDSICTIPLSLSPSLQQIRGGHFERPLSPQRLLMLMLRIGTILLSLTKSTIAICD